MHIRVSHHTPAQIMKVSVYGFPSRHLEKMFRSRLSEQIFFGREKKASSTLRASQAVPHPSTDRALQCLTSEFR